MIYDLNNALQAENFKLRCNALFKGKKKVELKEWKPKRSNQQNRYLHLILGYFGSQLGYQLEYVKEQYFKKYVNPDIFVSYKEDRIIGRVEVLRSSRDLTSAEMTTAIERFRNWSADQGIYIPAPNEEEYLQAIEIEIERYKDFL